MKIKRSIFDLEGSIIMSFTENEVNLNGIPEGSYLLKVQDLNSSQEMTEHILITNN